MNKDQLEWLENHSKVQRYLDINVRTKTIIYTNYEGMEQFKHLLPDNKQKTKKLR